MKKVVLKPKEEVSIDSVTDDSIVGIIYKNGEKGYLSILNNRVIGLYIYESNLGESFVSKESKKEYCKYQINNCDAKAIYLFDTEQEIKDWLKS